MQDISIDKKRLQWFMKHFTQDVLVRDLNLFYKGQVPNVAALIFKGTILLNLSGTREMKIEAPTLIGLCSLLEDKVAGSDVVVKEGAEIIIFDKVLYQLMLEKKRKRKVKRALRT